MATKLTTDEKRVITVSGMGCLAIMAFIGLAVAIPCVIVISLVGLVL